INAGIVPGDGGGYYLPRIVGKEKALEMLWLGEIITAEEALNCQLVSYVINHENLESFTKEFCGKILRKPQEVIQMMKRIVNESTTMTLRQSLDYVSSQMAISVFHNNHEQALEVIKERFNK